MRLGARDRFQSDSMGARAQGYVPRIQEQASQMKALDLFCGTHLPYNLRPAFILNHLRDFRLLCANHHRELTITGKIEGSSIRQ